MTEGNLKELAETAGKEQKAIKAYINLALVRLIVNGLKEKGRLSEAYWSPKQATSWLITTAEREWGEKSEGLDIEEKAKEEYETKILSPLQKRVGGDLASFLATDWGFSARGLDQAGVAVRDARNWILEQIEPGEGGRIKESAPFANELKSLWGVSDAGSKT